MHLNSTARSRKLTNVLTQIFAIGVLLGALAIATGVAPASWIKFERVNGRVTARTHACVFFIVPYHTVKVDPVEKLETDIVSGSYQRRYGRDILNSKADDVGYLNIVGPAQKSEVPIDPSSLTSVKDKAYGFINDPQAMELEMFVVANWTFSLVFSGIATFLGLLIAVSLIIGVVQALLRALGSGPRAKVAARRPGNFRTAFR